MQLEGSRGRLGADPRRPPACPSLPVTCSISAGYVPESLALGESPSCSVSMGTDSAAGCQGCLFSNFALCLFWKVFAASHSQSNPFLWLG